MLGLWCSFTPGNHNAYPIKNEMPDILLMEDDEILLKALTRFLEKEGFTVKACANGKLGLEQLEQHHFDLVITDLNMPYANGFEVMSKIKAQDKHKDVPVIVITSMSSEAAITQCFQIGASDFIRKPVTPHELHIRIRKLLGSFA
jgi:DNA-binding response OmpR family regulator